MPRLPPPPICAPGLALSKPASACPLTSRQLSKTSMYVPKTIGQWLYCKPGSRPWHKSNPIAPWAT
eukprot:5720066-Karenia_brevis.AAC.1